MYRSSFQRWRLNGKFFNIGLYTKKYALYNIRYNTNILRKGHERMEESMTLDELKQVNIDYYVNLIRIKKFQKEINPELEYQLKIQKNKLHALGVNTNEFEYDN